MGELIYMAEYLERKAGPSRQDISKRLAAIAVEKNNCKKYPQIVLTNWG